MLRSVVLLIVLMCQLTLRTTGGNLYDRLLSG